MPHPRHESVTIVDLVELAVAFSTLVFRYTQESDFALGILVDGEEARLLLVLNAPAETAASLLKAAREAMTK